MTDGKFYWLKLKKDFFKRHDIRIVETMPNGKDYILFYLKLLCESLDHNGSLRFSDSIPYSEDMLAVITNTNVDIVRSAVKVFTELGMMELLDDGTLFMTEVNKMCGSAVDNDNANRQRRFRERQKQLALDVPKEEPLHERYESVTKSNESKSKNKSKSIELNTIDNLFDQFWSVYPRKVAKVNAKKAFEKKCTTEKEFQKIMDGLKKYVEGSWSGKDLQYVPHPATWLNAERWNDDIQITDPKMPGYMKGENNDNEVVPEVDAEDIRKMLEDLR